MTPPPMDAAMRLKFDDLVARCAALWAGSDTRDALWRWHLAQVAAAREGAVRECLAVVGRRNKKANDDWMACPTAETRSAMVTLDSLVDDLTALLPAGTTTQETDHADVP